MTRLEVDALKRSVRSFTVLMAGALAAAAANGPASGLNAFAANSYQQLARGDQNIILSPFSVSTAISMLLAGARGRTASEISAVLGQKYPDPSYHARIGLLTDELAQLGKERGVELSMANALWIQQGFPVQSDFRQLLASRYGASPAQLDFFRSADQARSEINLWTEQKTKGKVRDLFGPGSLDPSTVLVLTSAIYFDGKWASAFARKDTKPGPFRTDTEATSQTIYMSQTGKFGYAEMPGAQILEMKYAGAGLAFDAFLPSKPDGLRDLEKTASADNLASWLGGLREREVHVFLPRFRASSEFSLEHTLSRMGMPTAFGGSADFSGIDDRRDLRLTTVVHKAFVDVTEEGTVAAAATGAGVALVAMAVNPTPVFRADHPFFFVIRDTRTGVVLFEGRLMNPSQS